MSVHRALSAAAVFLLVVSAPGCTLLSRTVGIDIADADNAFPAVHVEVTDQSGALTDARSATAAELHTGQTERIFVTQLGGNPKQVLVRWIGSGCDRAAKLTIESNAKRIVVAPGPRNGCDAMGVGRGVVLTFGRAVDAVAIVPILEDVELIDAEP